MTDNAEILTARFPARLRELRRQAGLTQAALAKAAGILQATVSMLEGGQCQPQYDTLVRLACALGVSLDQFTESPAEVPTAKPRKSAR